MKLFKETAAGPTRIEYIYRQKSVLEFGPGISTCAFIEAGVEEIVCCESQDGWLKHYENWIKNNSHIINSKITLLPFDDCVYPLSIPSIDHLKFDMAFVDSPRGHKGQFHKFKGYESCSRFATTMYAIQHSDHVFLHDVNRDGEKETLKFIEKLGYKITIHNQGALSDKGLAEIAKNQ